MQLSELHLRPAQGMKYNIRKEIAIGLSKIVNRRWWQISEEIILVIFNFFLHGHKNQNLHLTPSAIKTTMAHSEKREIGIEQISFLGPFTTIALLFLLSLGDIKVLKRGGRILMKPWLGFNCNISALLE